MSAVVWHFGSHQETAASRKEAKKALKLLLGMVAMHSAWKELLPKAMGWCTGRNLEHLYALIGHILMSQNGFSGKEQVGIQ
jgi:hypothetical protein